MTFTAEAWAGVDIPFVVHTSETATVTGTPRVAVDVGGVTRYATYTSGSGTNALTFTFLPQAGDVDLDGITVSSPIDLNGGTIKDIGGNDLASLAFTPPNTSGIKVNYPSLGMDFVYDADGRYTLNGTAYNDLTSFLAASGGTFTRASIGTYFDSAGALQTAASGVPRFDWDPITHAAKGILIEESRTNLLPNSQSDASWVAGGTTPPTVANSQTYLGIPCATVTFTTANTSTSYFGSRATRQGAGATYATLASGVKYASSMFLSLSRALTGSEQIGIYFTGGNGLGISYISAANSSTYVGKWVRVIMPPITTISTASDYPTVFLQSVVSSDVTIYVSRWQVEVGAFSTSYIPTGASTVTRAADVIQIPTGGWTGAGLAGSLYAQASTLYSSAADTATIRDVARISDGTSNNYERLFQYKDKYGGSTSSAGVLQADLQTGTIVAGTTYKIAYGFADNDFRSAVSGTLSAADTAGSLPSGVTTLYVGGTSPTNGNLMQFKYYPARLPNTQLQLLTQ